MTPVLLDTGCIVALLDRSERHHARCVEIVAELAAPLATCEAVIAEACWLLRGIPGAAEAVLENVDAGVFAIPFRLSASSAGVRRVLKRYARVPIDLADACLVELADELDTPKVFTLDSDFRVYRWRKNRAFELVLQE